MTEMEQFKKFFKSFGVTFSMGFDDSPSPHYVRGPKNPIWVVSVSQAHFYFDKKTRVYLGVKDDEMGNYYPREKTCKRKHLTKT